MKAFTYIAGLTQLVFMLGCAIVAEYAPTAGRHLGRWAGRAIRAGRAARRWYEAHGRERVEAVAAIAEYEARRFVAEQLGEAAPALRAVIEPARVALHEVVEAVETIAVAVDAGVTATASMTIRELKALAQERGIPNWSRLRKAELIAAIG